MRKPDAAKASPAAPAPPIEGTMDVTTATFEREVLEASKSLPVVIDFWAPWCGPCRTLTPVIERIAEEFAGRVKVVKINVDENQELAAAFAVRSIPYVVALKEGQPVAQFLGAQPEGQVRAFIEQLVPSASGQALARAEAACVEGRLDEAERELAAVQPEPALELRMRELRKAIAFAREAEQGPGAGELEAKLAANPDDHEARSALAKQYASQRRYREAMEALLEIMRRDRNWQDGEARKQLLALFELAASQPELVGEYRRKLAGMLY
jgi:putative thioredoxin